MSKIPVENAILYAQSTGTGTPVLMICGMASDVASWTPLVPFLETKFELLSYDNRGAGRTVTQSESWTIENYVEDALAVLVHYKVRCAHVVGHSLGGMIALRLAAKHPDRVKTIVSLASANIPGKESVEYFRNMSQLYGSSLPKIDWFKKLLPSLFSPGFFPSEQALNQAAQSAATYAYYQSPENLEKQVVMLASIKPVPLENIAHPVLSITGEKDLAFPPHIVREELEILPNVTFKTLPNAAHSIHWEAPEIIASEITQFLAAHPL